MAVKPTTYNPKEIKRVFSKITDPTARVKAVVAHVISDMPEHYDVWVGEGYVVVSGGSRYIGDVVRRVAWWLKEFGWFVYITPVENGYRIEYLPVVAYGR
jgi:O-methyltransferase involved in polyketide biosynthesis